MAKMGFDITHVYGLTEVYGPAAVVAKPDPKWGETPVAFVELALGAQVTAEELIAHCKSLLAGYKVPREIRFEPIPKTSTGKIQKFMLREKAKSTAAFD
jgi:fatty-acyl-CoA synthase